MPAPCHCVVDSQGSCSLLRFFLALAGELPGLPLLRGTPLAAACSSSAVGGLLLRPALLVRASCLSSLALRSAEARFKAPCLACSPRQDHQTWLEDHMSQHDTYMWQLQAHQLLGPRSIGGDLRVIPNDGAHSRPHTDIGCRGSHIQAEEHTAMHAGHQLCRYAAQAN